jgi:toxin ParE1/3/4
MSREVVVSSRAEKDLEELATYISRDNLDAALRLIDAANATFESLARFPGLGEPCEFDNPRLAEMRRWRIDGFVRYLLFYIPRDDEIEVVRILHGARDLNRVFGIKTN